GLLVARFKFEFARTSIVPLDEQHLDEVNANFAELEDRGNAARAAWNALTGAAFVRHVRMRYVGQGYEIGIEIPAGRTLGAEDLGNVRRSFEDAYQQLYRYADRAARLEVVDWRVTALGPPPDAAVIDHPTGETAE